MKIKKIGRWIIIIILIIAALVVFQQIKRARQNARGAGETKNPVKLVKAALGEMDDIVYLSGTLTAENAVMLKSKIAGKIEAIYAEEGQIVSKGQLLLKLEDVELSAQLHMANARLHQAKEGALYQNISTNVQIQNAQKNLNDAKIDYERSKALFEKGAIPKQQIEDALLRYEVSKTTLEQAKSGIHQNAIQKENILAAEEQVKAAQAQFNNTIIRAPFDGIITRKNCNLGQVVPAGGETVLLQIANNSNVYFEGFVAETDIEKIVPSQKAKVEVYALGKTFNGEVKSVSQASDPDNRSLHVKIKITDPNVKLNSGLASSALITVKKYAGVLLPAYMIRGVENNYFVVIPDSGKARFKHVQVGIKDENNAIITEGLQKDENIISMGNETLKEGDQIEIEIDDRKK